jgi:YHS domain-containing protein
MNLRMPFVICAVSVAALLLAGCGDKPADSTATPAPAAAASPPAGGETSTGTAVVDTGKPLGSVKVGGRAVCAVCSVKEGTKEEEEVKATLDYQGKTYGFCNEGEKAEFISNPAKYVAAK